jgi:hypothetical protein
VPNNRPVVLCPCLLIDVDPDTITGEFPDGVCECGHVPDEHDDGGCMVELDDYPYLGAEPDAHPPSRARRLFGRLRGRGPSRGTFMPPEWLEELPPRGEDRDGYARVMFA